MALGIIPAAGAGTRIQPLAFSKELLPVGPREGAPVRPRAVSEYIVERMMVAGARRICFVISPGKHDILQHHGAGAGDTRFVYAVQDAPRGLCDAIFAARAVVRRDEPVMVGLPDTVWFPVDGLARLPEDRLAFLLFPVDRPELFDAVVADDTGAVAEIRVKSPARGTNFVWGAFRMPGAVFEELALLWERRGRRDEYVGTLVNAFLAEGGQAAGVRAGERYVDVGTFDGYRDAIELLRERDPSRGTPAGDRRGRRAEASGGAPGGNGAVAVATEAGE
jgi:dTDP-glucose pyrophosphorylase